MAKFLSIFKNIIGYTLVVGCFVISVLALMGFIDKEIVSSIKGWLLYLYIAAFIIVIYKMTVLFFTSFYEVKITKRKVYLHSIIDKQTKEKALQNQKAVECESITTVIEAVKQMPDVNADALVNMLQERLPEVVQKLVDQQVSEIKRNIDKENEEHLREINFLSASVSDVLDRRNYLLNIEKEIKRCQEEERKRRLANTEEYTMLVFSLAGTSVEDVEKVCDIVKLFIETGQVAATKDLHIPLNKKLRNAELKQFVTNIIKYNEKDNLDAESFLQTAFGEWFSGKKENIAKNYSVLPKDSLVSKDGLEADLEHLRKLVGRKESNVDE
jgi:heme exporter protein D